jgi:hypothetical protein
LTPVDSTGQPIAFVTGGGGGLNAPKAFSCTITAGALSGCQVPDSALTTQVHLLYTIDVNDTASGFTFRLPTVPNITGANWALDAYAPSSATTNSQTVQVTYGTSAAPSPCATPSFYYQTGVGLSVCVGGVPVAVGSGSGGGTFGSQTGCSTDASGHITCAGFATNGGGSGNAGYVGLGQGTPPTVPANTVMLTGPASVPTSYTIVAPAGPPTGANIVQNCTATNPSICSWAPTGSGTGALTKISQTVVSTATPSVTFSSIPGTYTSLKIVFTGQASGSVTDVNLQFNGDTASNYSWVQSLATPTFASSSGSGTSIHAAILTASSAAPAATSEDCTIAGYAGAVFGKNVNCSYTVFNGGLVIGANNGEWSSTAAITSVTVFPTAGNFVTGTTVTLYGVQ